MEKTLFLIMGITGDLAVRKILPSLFEIEKLGTENITTLGIGRRPFEKTDFYNYLCENCFCEDEIDEYKNYLNKIGYFKLDMSTKDDYPAFKEYISQQRKDFDNIILYLSISPDFFAPVIANLKEYGIDKMIDRIGIEKPFGNDLGSAVKLNNVVLESFEENQIYRVDHYLGKEGTQNILPLRFGNIMLENIRNNKYIDNIQIMSVEKLGVLNRGGYYDNYGALRDMLQNHMLQVLALVAMDKPKSLESGDVRDEKLKVFNNLKIDEVVFGQYKGYLEEKGVDPKSKTDTFVAMKLSLDTPDFKNIPIYIKTGKLLDSKKSKVIVQFKKSSGLFDGEKNKLVIDFSNKEGIYMDLNMKEIGEDKKLKISTGIFNEKNTTRDAYFRIILDMVKGNGNIFPRWDMIQKSWELVQPLLDDQKNIYTYEPYSRGPKQSDELLEKEGKMWLE